MKTIGHPIIAGLPDVAADLFTFALQLRKTADPGDAEPFRLKVDELFRSFEQGARQAEVPDNNVQLAKYAIAAMIDEMILNSNWPLKEAWSGQPLQLRYFNDFSAGEEFFNKLDSLRGADDPKKIDVLEIYYTCLALGFKGKYGDLQGMEKLKSLTEGLAKDLRKVRAKGVEGLSPQPMPPDQMPTLVKNFPAWIAAVAVGTVLFFIYIVLSWILGGIVNGKVKGLG